LQGFRTGLTRSLKKYADAGMLDKLKFDISGDDFREGLTAISVKLLNHNLKDKQNEIRKQKLFLRFLKR
jgi:DNA gyrase/topoisomerase IV subunit B